MAVRRRRAKGHMHLHMWSRALVSETPVPTRANTDPLQICLAPVELAVGGLATCVVIGGRAVSKACATQLARSRPPSKSLAKSRISGAHWLIAKPRQARTRPGVVDSWRLAQLLRLLTVSLMMVRANKCLALPRKFSLPAPHRALLLGSRLHRPRQQNCDDALFVSTASSAQPHAQKSLNNGTSQRHLRSTDAQQMA